MNTFIQKVEEKYHENSNWSTGICFDVVEAKVILTCFVNEKFAKGCQNTLFVFIKVLDNLVPISLAWEFLANVLPM